MNERDTCLFGLIQINSLDIASTLNLQYIFVTFERDRVNTDPRTSYVSFNNIIGCYLLFDFLRPLWDMCWS